jgi:fructokinase
MPGRTAISSPTSRAVPRPANKPPQRRPFPKDFADMVETRVAGIELGGTKCIASLASADGTIIAQHTLPTLSPAETLPPLADLLAQWRRDLPFAAIGVGSFGPVELDPAAPNHGHVTSTSKPGWRDTDVLGALRGGHDEPWVSIPTSMPRRWPKAAGARRRA